MKHNDDARWLHNPLKNDDTLYYRRRDGITVEHMVRPAAYEMRRNHFHPEYEIYFLMHGRRQIFYENHPCLLEEGGMALVDSGRIHMTLSVSDDADAYYERIILYINKEKVDEYDRIFPELGMGSFFRQYEGVYRLSSEERTRLMEMFEIVMQELDGGQTRSRTLIDLTIIRFFINFWRMNRSGTHIGEKSERQKKGRFSTAHEVSKYISEHFCEHIPLEKLAERFGVSESYLSRSFKNVVGVGIREYINILRIRKGQEMLEDSELSVAEIAEAVGFDSANYFGRVFQTHLAASPSQYRKGLSAKNRAEKQQNEDSTQ